MALYPLYPFLGVDGFPFGVNPFPLIATAANTPSCGGNPAYGLIDFYSFYPQFKGNVPDVVVEAFIAMANAAVLQVRWHSQWTFGMALYIAHFLTLYMQTSTTDCASASRVLGAAQARGIQTAKSVGDVSVSYDFGPVLETLSGWAQFNLTAYGIQFASLAKTFGKAGMYIH